MYSRRSVVKIKGVYLHVDVHFAAVGDVHLRTRAYYDCVVGDADVVQACLRELVAICDRFASRQLLNHREFLGC